jgi:hypothetical protein
MVFLTQACSTTPSTNILPLNGPSNSSIFTGYVQQLPLPTLAQHLANSLGCQWRHTPTLLLSLEQARVNAALLKMFVHEVLRQS